MSFEYKNVLKNITDRIGRTVEKIEIYVIHAVMIKIFGKTNHTAYKKNPTSNKTEVEFLIFLLGY